MSGCGSEATGSFILCAMSRGKGPVPGGSGPKRVGVSTAHY